MQNVEEASLKDLERIVKDSKEYGLKLVVIGGYAVRAYTRGYRLTKDIDCVIPKEGIAGLRALLDSLGYGVRETEFGLAGKRGIDGGFIDLHISVGDVFDASTNRTYSADKDTFGNSKLLEISGFYKETKTKVKAYVIPMEELMILKLMTRGRDKDIVDIIALLADKGADMDIGYLVECCSKRGLNRHIRDNINSLIGSIKMKVADSTWSAVTGRPLMWKDRNQATKLLSGIERKLR